MLLPFPQKEERHSWWEGELLIRCEEQLSSFTAIDKLPADCKLDGEDPCCETHI